MGRSVSVAASFLVVLAACACGEPSSGIGAGPRASAPPPGATALPDEGMPETTQSPDEVLPEATPFHGTTTSTNGDLVNGGAFERFVWAYGRGNPATWEYVGVTTEGDPVSHLVTYDGEGTSVTLQRDTRRDRFAAPVERRITTYTCEAVADEVRRVHLRACESGGERTAFVLPLTTAGPEEGPTAVLPDLGTTTNAHGEITGLAARDGFVRTYRERRPGRWTYIVVSIHGDPVIYTLRHDGLSRTIRVTIDASALNGGDERQRMQWYECRGMAQTRRELRLRDCVGRTGGATLTLP